MIEQVEAEIQILEHTLFAFLKINVLTSTSGNMSAEILLIKKWNIHLYELMSNKIVTFNLLEIFK